MMKLRSRTGAGLPPSFRIGDGNNRPNHKCAAIFKRHSLSCQTNISYRTKATRARKEQNEKKNKRTFHSQAATAAESNSRTAAESNTRNE